MTLTKVPKIGDLIVADVATIVGYFTRSVVLILDIDDTGALGVALNKVTQSGIDEYLPGWSRLTCPPQTMFSGGPVSPNGAICLASVDELEEEPLGWRKIVGNVGLLHLDTPKELVAGTYSQLRIYAGYAGWGPGQLNEELEKGFWHVAKATNVDIFTAKPGNLWRNVLRRQGGSLGMTASWVADPKMN